MENRIQAYFIVNETELGLEYDSDHPQSFMAAAWRLWTAARELDVLPDSIEPRGVEGLQLLAQMQLVDETELKKLLRDIGGLFKFVATRPGSGPLDPYQDIMSHWAYSKNPLDILRTQKDLDFHAGIAISQARSLLKEFREGELDRINSQYPGENYQHRFWVMLLDNLIFEKR